MEIKIVVPKHQKQNPSHSSMSIIVVPISIKKTMVTLTQNKQKDFKCLSIEGAFTRSNKSDSKQIQQIYFCTVYNYTHVDL